MTQPADVEFASERYRVWLTDFRELADLSTWNQAQHQIRAVMNELRRCLAPADVLIIANALPPLPRGLFLEDWRLDETTAAPDTLDELLNRMNKDPVTRNHHEVSGEAVRALFGVWCKHLGATALEQIREVLPPVFLPAWPDKRKAAL